LQRSALMLQHSAASESVKVAFVSSRVDDERV
jgi:hypothetical protein